MIWDGVLGFLKSYNMLRSCRTRSNGAYYCLCVFHHEKTPSLVFYPSGIFFCYGCMRRGILEDFLREMNEMYAVDPADILACQTRYVPPIKGQLELF